MQKELMFRHIVEKSLELFSMKPTNQITMEEIAARCSITKPTLYSYFKNKDALIYALFNEIYSRMYAEVQKYIAQTDLSKNSWNYFEKLLEKIIYFFFNYRNIIHALIRETHQSCSLDVEEHFQYFFRKREELIDYFQEILAPLFSERIKQVADLRSLTLIVLNVIMAVVGDHYFNERFNWEKYRVILKEFFQNGIFSKEDR